MQKPVKLAWLSTKMLDLADSRSPVRGEESDARNLRQTRVHTTVRQMIATQPRKLRLPFSILTLALKLRPSFGLYPRPVHLLPSGFSPVRIATPNNLRLRCALSGFLSSRAPPGRSGTRKRLIQPHSVAAPKVHGAMRMIAVASSVFHLPAIAGVSVVAAAGEVPNATERVKARTQARVVRGA